MVQQMLGLVVLAIISFPAGPSGSISLSVKDVPVNQAIKAVVEAAGGSASFVTAEMAKGPKVTVEFKKIAPEKALAMIAQAAGLQCEKSPDDPKTVIISRSLWPASVKVGDGEVPIVGATAPTLGPVDKPITYVTWLPANKAPREGVVTFPGPEASQKRPSFDGENRLVDLDVKNAPLSEVAAKLSHKVPTPAAGEVPMTELAEASGGRYDSLEILVDDSAKNVKVTASIRKWPLGYVLDMLTEQTNLVCSVEEVKSGRIPFKETQAAFNVRTTKVYLVPSPELTVSGPGVRRFERRILTTGGGRGGGGVSIQAPD
jgi:hypothetical protein